MVGLAAAVAPATGAVPSSGSPSIPGVSTSGGSTAVTDAFGVPFNGNVSSLKALEFAQQLMKLLTDITNSTNTSNSLSKDMKDMIAETLLELLNPKNADSLAKAIEKAKEEILALSTVAFANSAVPPSADSSSAVAFYGITATVTSVAAVVPTVGALINVSV